MCDVTGAQSETLPYKLAVKLQSTAANNKFSWQEGTTASTALRIWVATSTSNPGVVKLMGVVVLSYCDVRVYVRVYQLFHSSESGCLGDAGMCVCVCRHS